MLKQSKRRKLSHEETLNAAIALPARASRHKAAEHREIILVLAHKKLGHRAIAAFLKERGILVHQTAISRYLRMHPPTEAEQRKIADILVAQAGATVSDTDRRRRREELLAPARKVRTEPEDKTDYSFLKVQGRPFTIRPRE